MDKLNIYHYCPACNVKFSSDYDFALHIANYHEEDFFDNLNWIDNLPDTIYIMADSMISGDYT